MEQAGNDRWFVVFNPMAGSRCASQLLKEIESALLGNGMDYEPFFIKEDIYAADFVAAAVKKGFRRFIAVGGDGTLNQVLCGIMSAGHVEERIVLGVIPVGSGNDWIKLYGIPKDYREAVKVIAGGRRIPQDVGKVTFLSDGKTYYLMNVAGAGLDAYVCECVNRMKSEGKRGRRIYVEGLAKAFFSYKNRNARIFCDGREVYEGRLLSVSVGNGRYTGGGMLQTPDAVPDDGLFDVSVIRAIPFGKLIFKVKKLFNGSLPSDPYVIADRCRSLRIESSPSTLVEVDGEVLGSSPVLIENMNLAIDVMIP